MCIRCGLSQAADPIGYCAACALSVRIEVIEGFKRLEAYLAAWAAFENWLAERGVEAR